MLPSSRSPALLCALQVATASAQAILRFGSGAFVSGNLSSFKKRPSKPIELYEFEGCPFCRKVREACSILDIDVQYYPCPQGGPNFRPKVLTVESCPACEALDG